MRVPTLKLGSRYGGNTICPTGLSKNDVVYSCGVGTDLTFDRELIDRFAVDVHAFDPTPRSIEWVRGQSLPSKLFFHPCGVGGHDGDAFFTPPSNSSHVSYSNGEGSAGDVVLPIKRVGTIMTELGHSEIALLKLDIEGSEYEVIDDVVRSELDVKQIVVEFHHRIHRRPLEQTRFAIDELRSAGFRIFSISPNGDVLSFVQAAACT
jgi:FkbM family methyltransferase